MIIGFDAKSAFHCKRGIGNYSRDTVRILSEYFPDNRYLLFNTDKKNNVQFPIKDNTKEILPETSLYKAFPSLWRGRGIKGQIGHEGVEIYHGLSQELPKDIQHANVKTVVTFHDAIRVRYPELHSKFKNNQLIRRSIHACKVADKIIAISEQTKQDCIDLFGADERKITVVYQGCNNLYRIPVNDSKKEIVKQRYELPPRYILTVGSIEKRKNAVLIVEAMHRSNLSIPLVIVGKGKSYIDEIKAVAEKYNLQSQIIFRHNVPLEDLPAIYSLSEIFLFPSLFEGFGIPILEAMCCGIPVITSKGSCFKETGGDAALYIDPYNANELADAIYKVLSDNKVREEMISKGKLQSDKFTDDKIAQNLMNVYQSFEE